MKRKRSALSIATEIVSKVIADQLAILPPAMAAKMRNKLRKLAEEAIARDMMSRAIVKANKKWERDGIVPRLRGK